MKHGREDLLRRVWDVLDRMVAERIDANLRREARLRGGEVAQAEFGYPTLREVREELMAMYGTAHSYRDLAPAITEHLRNDRHSGRLKRRARRTVATPPEAAEMHALDGAPVQRPADPGTSETRGESPIPGTCGVVGRLQTMAVELVKLADGLLDLGRLEAELAFETELRLRAERRAATAEGEAAELRAKLKALDRSLSTAPSARARMEGRPDDFTQARRPDAVERPAPEEDLGPSPMPAPAPR